VSVCLCVYMRVCALYVRLTEFTLSAVVSLATLTPPRCHALATIVTRVAARH